MKKSKKNPNVANVESKESIKFKSKLIQNLIGKYKKENLKEEEKEERPKDSFAINLSDILVNIDSLSEEEISNIVSDVNANNITISVNKRAIKILNDENLDQEKIQKVLAKLTSKINIDISSISDLSTDELNNIKQRCTINRVYVNTGYDEAAKRGYDVKKYMQIRTNADLIREKAIGKRNDGMSQMDIAKRIYRYVVDYTEFDHSDEAKANNCAESRNLENFFTKGRRATKSGIRGKGKAVCAGIASGLQNMLECEGIECQYVQGMTKVGNRYENHAWLKAKLDGKWVNLDPTWDVCKVGRKPFTYFAKDDKFFSCDHDINNRYSPNYSRGAYIPTQPRIIHASADASSIEKNPMGNIIDENYIREYMKSRNEILEKNPSYYESLSQDDSIRELREKEILTKMTAPKLTLKQKLADFLYKGKILKNVSFIKEFINKNSLKYRADVEQKATKKEEEKENFIQKIDGKLEEANKNLKDQPQIVMTKNEKDSDRDVG